MGGSAAPAARAITTSDARARIDIAKQELAGLPRGTTALLVGATRGALDDLAAEITFEAGATYGLFRRTLAGLATETAALPLAEAGLTPARRVLSDAIVANVVRDACERGDFDAGKHRVATTPGYAIALARTLDELDMEGVEPDVLRGSPKTLDLAHMLEQTRAAFTKAKLVSRADTLRCAAAQLGSSPFVGVPVVLLDVAIHHRAQRDLVAKLVAEARRFVAVVHPCDTRTLDALAALGVAVEPARASAETDVQEAITLRSFRARLFSRELDSSGDDAPLDTTCVALSSAPSEALEAVEVARAALQEARRGVPFDEMAVVVRSRETYAAHLAAAFGRADIPVHFETGTRRPHPTGRALLALLACRAERGSGRRLFEYLSTAQAPPLTASEEPQGAPRPPEPDEDLGRFGATDGTTDAEVREPPARIRRPPLRRWMRILGEIGVSHGGTSIFEYVQRRVDLAKRELEETLAAVQRDEGDTVHVERQEADIRELDELSACLAPVLRGLDRVPLQGTWGEMLSALGELAGLALARPALVAALLAELEPLTFSSTVVGLDEVMRALGPRLRWLERPARRARDAQRGAVLVTTPLGIRGRARRVTFVVGLAEGIFPAKTREDPLFSDQQRQASVTGARTSIDRTREERSALELAAGSATERLYFSYPRLESESGRQRVASVYALEVARAIGGSLPSLGAMDRAARPKSRILLAWPSPSAPRAAIDDVEYALAVIRELKGQDAAKTRGRARFLIDKHAILARALRARWQRHDAPRFSAHDGLNAQRPETLRRLADHRLAARPYSPSTLEAFAACPYRFYLRGLVHLSSRPDPEPVDRLDPRLYGELYHRCQSLLTRVLVAEGLDVGDASARPRVVAAIAATVRRVTAEARDQLEPLVARVFEDEMGRIEGDLVGWADDAIRRADGFRPVLAELSFGLPPSKNLAPESVTDDVRIAGGYRLKGAIDAVEQGPHGRLRITDYKTGRVPEDRARGGAVVGKGEMLQPILYALAVEALRGRSVASDAIVSDARLFWATRRGGYQESPVAIAADNVARTTQVLDAIDGAIERGALVAAPREGACERCTYRVVCGPDEEERTKRKTPSSARDQFTLEELRRIRGLL